MTSQNTTSHHAQDLDDHITDDCFDGGLEELLSDPIEDHFEAIDEFTQHRLARQIVETARLEPETSAPPEAPKSRTSRAIIVAAAISLTCSTTALILNVRDRPDVAPSVAQTATIAPAAQRPTQKPKTATTTQTIHSTSTWRVSSAHPSEGLSLGALVKHGQSIQTHASPMTLQAIDGHALGMTPQTALQPGQPNTLHKGEVWVEASHKDMSWRLDDRTTLHAKRATFAIQRTPQQWSVHVLRGQVTLKRARERFVAMRGETLYRDGAFSTRSLSTNKTQHLKRWRARLSVLSPETHATLHVATATPGASIHLGGVHMGHTPLEIAALPGQYSVTLKQSAHRDHTQTVIARANTPQKLHIQLTAIKRQQPRDTPRVMPPATKEAPIATLEMARMQQRKGQWRQAASTYQQLLKAPHQPSLNVTVGWLHLRHLKQPAEAITYFDRYLQRVPHGPLKQEALLGRVKAQRAMGAPQQEARAIKALLKHNPDVSGAKQHKKRLNEIYKGLIKR